MHLLKYIGIVMASTLVGLGLGNLLATMFCSVVNQTSQFPGGSNLRAVMVGGTLLLCLYWGLRIIFRDLGSK